MYLKTECVLLGWPVLCMAYQLIFMWKYLETNPSFASQRSLSSARACPSARVPVGELGVADPPVAALTRGFVIVTGL